MKRREFLTGASAALATGGLALAGCDTKEEAPTKASSSTKPTKVTRLKMVTTWQPKFPVFQTGAERFAKRVETMSGGQVKIEVYAGGELVPPLEVFDAVSQGTVEMGHSAAYYWAGKEEAAQFFTAVPFGFSAQQMNAWLYQGGGLDLWNEVYAKHNLVAFPIANTGVQMGGWFNKEIKSVDDLKGLKVRMPGLGGKALSRAGANVVLLPPSELYTALERGVIDGLEWVGPYHDLNLGFYRAAKYYYYPGWHEPGTVIELLFNKGAWEKLPEAQQAIIRAAAAESNVKALAEFDAKNGDAMRELMGKYKVRLKRYPDDVILALRGHAEAILKEMAAANPEVKKVHDAFTAFAGKVEPWTRLSEEAYMEAKKF